MGTSEEREGVETAPTSRSPRINRPHPVDRMREINAMHDPDPFSGRPPIDSIEIRQRTYVTAKVQPLDVTGVRTIGVGAAFWLVAGLAMLPFWSELADAGRDWWLWTCAAGFGLGVVGVGYCKRRLRRQAERPPREVETSPLGAAGL